MDKQTVCITSGGDEVRNRSYVNHTIYAREHGFSHHLGIGLARGITSPYYYKFEVVHEILPFYRWTVWMDDDVYITDMGSDSLETLLTEAEAHDAFLVIAEGPTEPDGSWTKINTGVFALRNDPRSQTLLNAARAVDLEQLRTTWDSDEDGLFTNGDQDTVWQALRNDASLMAGTMIVDHRRLNSREHYFNHSLTDAFSVHFCGPGDKGLKTARFGRRFGLGHELVPDPLLDRWSVRKRQHMPRAEMVWREAQWRGGQFIKRVWKKIAFVKETGRWR